MNQGLEPDATGALVRLLPPGPECDELLGLVRIGIKFKSQHVGRRPGVLTNLVFEIVAAMDKPTFKDLLNELDLAAARRSLYGPSLHPVEKVDRIWGLLTYHDGSNRKQITFGRLRNIFSYAKK